MESPPVVRRSLLEQRIERAALPAAPALRAAADRARALSPALASCRGRRARGLFPRSRARYRPWRRATRCGGLSAFRPPGELRCSFRWRTRSASCRGSSWRSSGWRRDEEPASALGRCSPRSPRLQLLAGHPETAFFTALACGIYLLVRGCEGPASRRLGESRLGLVGRPPALGRRAGAACLHRRSDRALARSGRRRRDRSFRRSSPSGCASCCRTPSARRPTAPSGAPSCSCRRPSMPAHSRCHSPSLLSGVAASGWSTRSAPARGGRDGRRLPARAYHFPGVRELLLATPVVQKMLHHYLLLGVELGLALLAGAGLERWLAGDGRGLLFGALLPLAGLAFGWAAFHDDWSARGQITAEAGATVAGARPAAPRSRRDSALPPARRRRLAPLVVLLTLGRSRLGARRHQPGTAGRTSSTRARRRSTSSPRSRNGSRRSATRCVPTRRWSSGSSTCAVTTRSSCHATRRSTATSWRRRTRPSSARSSTGIRRGSTGSACAGCSRRPASAPPIAAWRVAYAGSDATVFDRGAAQPLVRREDGSPPPQVLSRISRQVGDRLARRGRRERPSGHRRDLGRRLARDPRRPRARRRDGGRPFPRRAAGAGAGAARRQLPAAGIRSGPRLEIVVPLLGLAVALALARCSAAWRSGRRVALLRHSGSRAGSYLKRGRPLWIPSALASR